MRYCWSASCVAGCSPGTSLIEMFGFSAMYSSTSESPSDCRPKSPQKATESSTDSPDGSVAESVGEDVSDGSDGVDGVLEEQAPSRRADAAPRAAMLAARLRDHFMPYPLWRRGCAPTLERSANIAPLSADVERYRSRFGDELIPAVVAQVRHARKVPGGGHERPETAPQPAQTSELTLRSTRGETSSAGSSSRALSTCSTTESPASSVTS